MRYLFSDRRALLCEHIHCNASPEFWQSFAAGVRIPMGQQPDQTQSENPETAFALTLSPTRRSAGLPYYVSGEYFFWSNCILKYCTLYVSHALRSLVKALLASEPPLGDRRPNLERAVGTLLAIARGGNNAGATDGGADGASTRRLRLLLQ